MNKITVKMNGKSFRVSRNKDLVQALHRSKPLSGGRDFGDTHYLTIWKQEDGEPSEMVQQVLDRMQ